MKGLGQRLRERAKELGLADATVAERVGLSQQRYHNYVSDQTEPDLQTLVRICKALGTEPNVVLGFAEDDGETGEEAKLQARLAAASATMGLATLRLAAAVVDTIANEDKRIQRPTAKRPAPKG